MVAHGRNHAMQSLSVQRTPFEPGTQIAAYSFTRAGKPEDWAVYQTGSDGSVDARRFFYDNGRKHGDTTLYVNDGVTYRAWMIVLVNGGASDITPVSNVLEFTA